MLTDKEDLRQQLCLLRKSTYSMWWWGLSATTTMNRRSIFENIDILNMFLCFSWSAGCGGHLEVGWLRTLIRCKYTSIEYFLKVSLQLFQRFTRYCIIYFQPFLPVFTLRVSETEIIPSILTGGANFLHNEDSVSLVKLVPRLCHR